jgi:hypothetical protein
LIRASTYCYGQFITKKEWKKIEEIFPAGYRSMKVRCLNDYIDNLKEPISNRKDSYIEYYSHRKDFHQKMTMVDLDPLDSLKLHKAMMEEIINDKLVKDVENEKHVKLC